MPGPDTIAPKRFLFLQGPISPFFDEVGAGLRALGHAVHRINLNLGDRLFWRGPGAVDFRGRAAEWPDFVAGFMDRHGITDLVLLGEQRPYNKAAIAAAAARGIRVAVTDFGYIRPDWIVLERDGMNAASRFTRDPAEIVRAGALLPPPDLQVHHLDDFRLQAAWDILYHLSTLLPWPFPHYESHQIYNPMPVYLGVLWRLLRRGASNRRADAILKRLAGTGPLFLMAMQMETDFSIRAYSKYRDLDTALREVAQSFAAHAPPDAHLLVKVHPLDPGLKNWKRRSRAIAREFGLEQRMHYLGGGNLGAIVEQVQGTVTVNSTVGLRSIIDHTPTFALGEALYRIPGLVFSGPLDRFWTEGTPPEIPLRESFLRCIAHSLHIRGVYYNRPGLDIAVRAAVRRLHRDLLNQPDPELLHPSDPAVPGTAAATGS
ncbi:capsule biosynthesis protein [Teichococcus vastitatis]|uniref:Capsular biosynthesis protein n=1 Tax=Teichococcus vastitatis TaxID=2307076 RepID=A0ABS9WC16_9PROT|nr:capsular biosynthesis protein [Pseudoroseomonas vastitatis]MCI0756776.1 capsular biosynthesis protein [Pseudoroseomonas vastitatis]